MKNKKTDKKAGMEIISFRLANEPYERLKAWAEAGQYDEAGLPLNPSIAARRLMNWALDRLEQVEKTFPPKRK